MPLIRYDSLPLDLAKGSKRHFGFFGALTAAKSVGGAVAGFSGDCSSHVAGNGLIGRQDDLP
jgi:hypothetical protein